MTNQQSAPEALPATWAQDLSTAISLLGMARVGLIPSDAASNARWRLDELSRALAALVEAQQPAPSAAAAGEVPLPLLVRDIAADLGTTPIQVCSALAQLGFGGHSVNMAVTPRMAQSLRAHFASPTPQADSAPASLAGPMQFGGCPECGSRTCVARQCSRTVSHAAQAVPGVQWQCGPQASGFTAPQADSQPAPIDMVLHCPKCGLQHIDTPEKVDRRLAVIDPPAAWAMDPWNNPPHRSHLCHSCGHIWRPADVPTNGVAAVKTTGKADSPIAARAPADSVTAPARPTDAQIDACARSMLYQPWGIGSRIEDARAFAKRILSKFAPTQPAQAADSVLEDAARWFSERDNVLHSFWVLLGEAEAQADNDNDPLLKHQVEGFYRQWNALNGSALVPRWVTRAARKQGGA